MPRWFLYYLFDTPNRTVMSTGILKVLLALVSPVIVDMLPNGALRFLNLYNIPQLQLETCGMAFQKMFAALSAFLSRKIGFFSHQYPAWQCVPQNGSCMSGCRWVWSLNLAAGLRKKRKSQVKSHSTHFIVYKPLSRYHTAKSGWNSAGIDNWITQRRLEWKNDTQTLLKLTTSHLEGTVIRLRGHLLPSTLCIKIQGMLPRHSPTPHQGSKRCPNNIHSITWALSSFFFNFFHWSILRKAPK